MRIMAELRFKTPVRSVQLGRAQSLFGRKWSTEACEDNNKFCLFYVFYMGAVLEMESMILKQT